jgi:tetratricopeptide (TPR) repeat protein
VPADDNDLVGDELESIYRRSDALVAEQLYEDEAALLRAALDRHPDDPELCLRMGRSLVATGDRLDEAKDLIVRAAALSSQDPWRLARCAGLLADMTEFDEASRIALLARAEAPADFVFDADLDHVLGRVAFDRGDLAEAERLLTMAFEREPSLAGHGWWLAQFNYVEQRPHRAMEVLAKALRHRPDDQALKDLRDEVLAYVRTYGESLSE